jgi:hypothetical protein
VLSLQVNCPFFAVPFHKARADVAFCKLPGGSQDFRKEPALDLCTFLSTTLPQEGFSIDSIVARWIMWSGPACAPAEASNVERHQITRQETAEEVA